MTEITVLPVPPGTADVRRRFVCRQAETVAGHELGAAGYAVVNLNDVVDDCPYMDLVATAGPVRILVQVRGTTTTERKFRALPKGALSLEIFAGALGCHALYAFVWMNESGGDFDVRYELPATVRAIADAGIADYPGTLRYHLTHNNLPYSVADLPNLLGLPGSGAGGASDR
jgi:hypothetical protein